MTPIINPWWFYLFDIVEKLGTTSTIIAILLGAFGLMYGIICGICEGEKIKFNKPFVILFIVSAFFAAFTPSKETCYKMAVASLVTPDNIAAVGDTATNIVDYIIDSVDKLLEDNEEGEVE